MLTQNTQPKNETTDTDTERGGQGTHHGAQEGCPVLAAKVPAVQLLHAVGPTAESLTENCPASQTAQRFRPVASAK